MDLLKYDHEKKLTQTFQNLFMRFSAADGGAAGFGETWPPFFAEREE